MQNLSILLHSSLIIASSENLMKIIVFWTLLACCLRDIKVSKEFLASSFRIENYCYCLRDVKVSKEFLASSFRIEKYCYCLRDFKVSKEFLASSFRIERYCYTLNMRAADPYHKW